jgi:hypothetical protein
MQIIPNLLNNVKRFGPDNFPGSMLSPQEQYVARDKYSIDVMGRFSLYMIYISGYTINTQL